MRNFFCGLVLVLVAVPLALGQEESTMATSGKIKSISDTKIILTDWNNKELTFQPATGVKVSLENNEGRQQRANLGDFKAGDQVCIVYAKDGEKLVCQEIISSRMTEGKVTSTEGNKLSITDRDDKRHTFTIPKNATFQIQERQGRLTDLKEGNQVTVYYTRNGDTYTAWVVRFKN